MYRNCPEATENTPKLHFTLGNIQKWFLKVFLGLGWISGRSPKGPRKSPKKFGPNLSIFGGHWLENEGPRKVPERSPKVPERSPKVPGIPVDKIGNMMIFCANVAKFTSICCKCELALDFAIFFRSCTHFVFVFVLVRKLGCLRALAWGCLSAKSRKVFVRSPKPS